MFAIVDNAGRIKQVSYADAFTINGSVLEFSDGASYQPLADELIVEIPDRQYSENESYGTVDPEKNPPIDLMVIKAQSIDKNTGHAINNAIHELCGVEEQIGILRADLAALHVQLGSEPTEDFVRLSEVATKKILEGQTRKEAP